MFHMKRKIYVTISWLDGLIALQFLVIFVEMWLRHIQPDYYWAYFWIAINLGGIHTNMKTKETYRKIAYMRALSDRLRKK